MKAKRVEGVQIERAADEILAVKTGSLEAHALNQSAAAVYELCGGETSKSEIAAEIRRRTGLPADDEIVDLALAELIDAGLVVLDDPEPRSTVTRRSLIRRLALTSVAAMMLPVVETILVPPAHAATPGAVPSPMSAPIPPVAAPIPFPMTAPTPTPTTKFMGLEIFDGSFEDSGIQVDFQGAVVIAAPFIPGFDPDLVELWNQIRQRWANFFSNVVKLLADSFVPLRLWCNRVGSRFTSALSDRRIR
jgi:Coenzyme PQQ synthesis protein D (PqqD)